MKKDKPIQKILGPYVKKYDFVYRGREFNSWYYSRRVGDIEQRICIKESRFAQELDLYFETSAFGSSQLSAINLIPKDKINLYFCADIVDRYEQKYHRKPMPGWWGVYLRGRFLSMFRNVWENNRAIWSKSLIYNCCNL